MYIPHVYVYICGHTRPLCGSADELRCNRIDSTSSLLTSERLFDFREFTELFFLIDKSSVAGSEEAEPLAPPIKPIKPVTRNKAQQEPPVKKGRRSRRCGQCSGCQVPEDCGVCTNCLDKPKFGGRNIKKQCCK